MLTQHLGAGGGAAEQHWMGAAEQHQEHWLKKS